MGQLLKHVKPLILIALLFFCNHLFAEQHPSESHSESFNPGDIITHHIGDSHEWHFATIGEKHYTIPLPVIIYSADRGLETFSSDQISHGHSHLGYTLDSHDHIISDDASRKIYDFSITKNVASLMISALLLLGIFISIANSYKKNPNKAPKGLQSFFEPIIMYVRDDIAKDVIGPRHEKYLPYLLTIFFFIWFNNLLGLFPGGANLTGNIAITLFLALATFLVTNLSGNKYYWSHIFNTPGVPLALKPLIVPIEIVGLFTKPFSLMVRLFANITAGHIIILSLLSLIFIFKHVAASLVSLPFALFMSFLELFVALLQAYIFTLLSAMYIGSAIEEHSHPDHDLGH